MLWRGRRRVEPSRPLHHGAGLETQAFVMVYLLGVAFPARRGITVQARGGLPAG